jgi:hypothetical protein
VTVTECGHRLVARPQDPLGGRVVAGKRLHLAHGDRVRGRRLAQPELLERPADLLDERPRLVELALHRTKQTEGAERRGPDERGAGGLSDLGRACDGLADGQGSAMQGDADQPHHVVLEMARIGAAGIGKRRR